MKNFKYYLEKVERENLNENVNSITFQKIWSRVKNY